MACNNCGMGSEYVRWDLTAAGHEVTVRERDLARQERNLLMIKVNYLADQLSKLKGENQSTEVQEYAAAFAAGARAYREIALATLAGREMRLAGRDPQFGLETLECWREIEALPLPEPERK